MGNAFKLNVRPTHSSKQLIWFCCNYSFSLKLNWMKNNFVRQKLSSRLHLNNVVKRAFIPLLSHPPFGSPTRNKKASLGVQRKTSWCLLSGLQAVLLVIKLELRQEDQASWRQAALTLGYFLSLPLRAYLPPHPLHQPLPSGSQSQNLCLSLLHMRPGLHLWGIPWLRQGWLALSCMAPSLFGALLSPLPPEPPPQIHIFHSRDIV